VCASTSKSWSSSSRARCCTGKRELRALGAADGSERWRAAQELRRERSLPRFVAVEDRDNRLPVDLDHVLSVDTFAQLVKDREVVGLVEIVPDFGELPVRGIEGRFVHEIVVPFRCTAPSRPRIATDSPPTAPTTEAPTPARRLPPGSDWLYVKLYAGAAAIDELLCDVIAPLVHAGRGRGVVREWFFVRYADPDTHLRVRFHGDPARLHSDLLPALLAATAAPLTDGKVWRAQLDTYHREIERYGGPVGMRLCEQLFAADSVTPTAARQRRCPPTRAGVWRYAASIRC
jgi:lantibiotic biosynthesis protein